MNTDSIFLKGKTHLVCQDYALNNVSGVIVADGCSGSKYSDLSARLLAHSASRLMTKGLGTNRANNYWLNGTLIENEASARGNMFSGLDLDSTVIMALVDMEEIFINVYGDGMLILVDKHNNIEIYEIIYDSNAPYYLSYWFNGERKTQYKNEFGSFPVWLRRTVVYNSGLVNIESNHCVDFDYKFEFNYFKIEKYKQIIISTDGLTSFYNSKTGNKVEVTDIVKNLVSFKSLSGEFLKRRVLRMVSDYQKEGIYHYDDLGLAAINL